MDVQKDTVETQLLTGPFSTQLDLILTFPGLWWDNYLYYQIPLHVDAPPEQNCLFKNIN